MNSLIEVFRMSEVSAKVRCEIIVKLGAAINNEYGMNLTEPLVLELVRQLEPNHKVCSDCHYLYQANEITFEEYMARKGK